MHKLTWIDDRRLAVSAKPKGTKEIEEWRRLGINAVVVLIENHEMSHFGGIWGYLHELKHRGFSVLHQPIRDFSVPTLEDALKTVRWINDAVEVGKKVLVHCGAGLGRSALIAACYLVYRYGMSPEDAIYEVKERRKGSLESPLQVFFVYRFADYLARVGASA